MENIGVEAQRAMGLAKFDTARKDIPKVIRQAVQRANDILWLALSDKRIKLK